MNWRVVIVVCFISLLEAVPLPPVTKSSEVIQPSSVNQNTQLNKTLEELMQQQADNVKQIVAEQNLQLPEFPINHKKEEELEQTNSKEDFETSSLDELKIKCQHLSKLLNLTSASQTKLSTGDSAAQSQIRPVYIQHRNQLTVTPTHKPYKPVNGFYVTSKPSILPTLPPNVKFIKLEPVILQKTMLSDGRIVYYWHRSLPSSIQYPSLPQNEFNKQTQAPYNNQNYNTPSTTTTPSSSGLSISHYFPFYWSSGSSSSSSSNQEASTEKPTTTTTTTVPTTRAPAPVTQKAFERDPGLYYANQLRFVVPVPYEEPESATRQPSGFDQFAYYPPQLQPSTVNVQVPYTPTFQMIKALTIPNKYVSINPDGSYENTNKA